jgi:hypothetical protein
LERAAIKINKAWRAILGKNVRPVVRRGWPGPGGGGWNGPGRQKGLDNY